MQRFKDDTVIISDNYNLDYIKNIGKQSNTLSLYRVKAQGLINLDVDKGTQLYIRHAQKVNYPILVDNNRIVYRNFSQPQWKFVQDIVKGDYVGYPILKTSVNLFDINEEEAWYIGRYIADGYAHDSVRKSGKKEYRVCFSIGDAKIDTFLSKAKQYHIYKVKDKGCYRCDISETCHTKYHQGKIKLPKTIKRGTSFKDATFMGIMRWAFYNKLKEIYPNVHMTYGYTTKNTRIKRNLPKEHYIDARCISDYPEAIHPWNKTVVYYQKKVRCHNRQIHKMSILKGGVRKLNQTEYLVKGYRLFDRVQYHGKEYFVFGRRKSGFFDIRTLNGEKVNKGSISYKKLKLLEISKGFLTERKVEA